MSEEKHVWIVHYNNYGDTWISAIFDSEEKALEYEEERDPAAKRRYDWDRDYRIEKHRIL